MKQKGFTLVEAIVSITIMVILGGITLANYSQIRREAEVNAELDLVIGSIRNAQATALSPDRGDFVGIDSDTLCSVGVRFDGGTNELQPYYRSINPILGDCDSSFVEARVYGDRVEFNVIQLANSSINVFFDTPFGGLSSASTPGDPLEILVEASQLDLSRRVLVYPSGMVETQ